MSRDRPLLALVNRVPEVTLFFWVIKILATTVGETAADYLNDTHRRGTPPLGTGCDPRLLGRLRVDPTSRCLDRRPAVPGQG